MRYLVNILSIPEFLDAL